jgi:hypothetical protein
MAGMNDMQTDQRAWPFWKKPVFKRGSLLERQPYHF